MNAKLYLERAKNEMILAEIVLKMSISKDLQKPFGTKVETFFSAAIGRLHSLILLVSRNPLITDDVSATNRCIGLEQKSDVIYIVPPYDGTFCKEFAETNKTIGMHGITHSYHEFLYPVDENVFNETIINFERCFGEKPKLFRPPNNRISEENIELVDKYGMKLYKTTYILHPYCHCNPNSYMKILNALIFC